MLGRGVTVKSRFSSFIRKMIETTKAEVTQPYAEKNKSIAEKVLERLNNNMYQPQHEAKLRAKFTLESKVDEFEKELQQEIARSLKNTEQKLVYKLSVANKALQHLNRLKQSEVVWEGDNLQLVQDYHKLLKECEAARYQLIVHRHSIGFTINNNELVRSLYKIPERFPV